MKEEIVKRLRKDTKGWSSDRFIDAMASLIELLAWYEMCLDGLDGSDRSDLLDEDDAADRWEVS